MVLIKNFKGNPTHVPEKLRGRLKGKMVEHFQNLGVTELKWTTAEDKETETTAIAICSPLDTFDKSLGISIAEGRLKRHLSGKPYPYKPKFISDED